MAKKSVIAREVKRARQIVRRASLRAQLRETMSNVELGDEERYVAEKRFHSLSPNSSKVRRQRRCRLCGRPNAVYRKFGLCRIHLREAAMRGDITGLVKSSW